MLLLLLFVDTRIVCGFICDFSQGDYSALVNTNLSNLPNLINQRDYTDYTGCFSSGWLLLPDGAVLLR